MRVYDTIRTVIISAIALTIVFNVYKAKSWNLRIPLSISVIYVIAYDIWDLYKPVTLLPFQLLWIATIIFSIIGLVLFFRKKKQRTNNKS